MSLQSLNSKSKNAAGFTLLELIVAMVILVIMMSVIFQAFSATLRGWRRGTEVSDGIKHGDFAMQQLASVLNSTIYFYNDKKSYAFTFEKETYNGLPADIISFVTASSAFMPEGSPLKNGPHRIKIYIDEDGNPALFSFAVPALADIEEFENEYETEPHLVSRVIQGLEIMVYDEESELWTEEWEKKNSIPERIKITVFVPSEDEDEEPIIFTRVLDIPVAKSVKRRLTGPSTVQSTDSTKSTPPPSTGKSGPSGGSAPSIKLPASR